MVEVVIWNVNAGRGGVLDGIQMDTGVGAANGVVWVGDVFACDADYEFCFFFSSRRRHTRWTGDWSSDVCSSDLGDAAPSDGGGNVSRWRSEGSSASAIPHSTAPRSSRRKASPSTTSCSFRRSPRCCRSEERRVGKECRCRWLPEQYEKRKRMTRR